MIGVKAPRALDLPVGTRWMRSFDHLTSDLVLGYELGGEFGSEALDSEAPEMTANAVVGVVRPSLNSHGLCSRSAERQGQSLIDEVTGFADLRLAAL